MVMRYEVERGVLAILCITVIIVYFIIGDSSILSIAVLPGFAISTGIIFYSVSGGTISTIHTGRNTIIFNPGSYPSYPIYAPLVTLYPTSTPLLPLQPLQSLPYISLQLYCLNLL